MRSYAAAIVVVVALGVAPKAAAQQPRDRAGNVAVGAIAGRIADRDSHAPIRWATVTIVATGFLASTAADAEGRFRFDRVPAGSYMLTVRKSGFVPLAFGARRPRDSAMRIAVTPGATAAADVLLSRGGAIEGRVLNEYGDPVQDVGIQAVRIGYDSSGRRTIPAGPGTRTDDMGWFRLHSLAPGMYLVEAARAALAPPAPNDEQEAVQRPKPFPRTYYPGTVRANEAKYLQVEKGRTRSIEFSLSTDPVNRLAGSIFNSSGYVPEMASAILRYATGAPFGGFSLGVNRNQFALAGIHPGDYLLVVAARTAGSEVEFALRPVRMTGQDVVEPDIRTRPGVVLEGTVQSESRDGTARPTSVAVAAVSTLFPGFVADPNQRQSPVHARPDGRFTLRSVFGPRLFRIVVDPPWALKAVVLDDHDVTDTPFSFLEPRDARPLQVVVTDRTGSLAGSAGGARAPEGTHVVAFSDDQRQWVFDSRYTRVAALRGDGSFEIAGLLPGRYLVAHVLDLDPGSAGDPEILAQLQSTAIAVVVSVGAITTVALPAAREP